jgi:archaellum biogenesis ATPase FlaH
MDTKLELIRMDTIETIETKWLWYPYIPFGKITIVQGNPGEGKTTFILAIASTLTTGGTLPLGDVLETCNVIYQTAEDGLGDTVKPRLISNNADCSKVLVIDESKKELTLTDERIEQAILQTKAKLLIIDPIQAFLGARVDMHRANEVRPIFKKLGNIAEKTGCAIVLIGHMNKNMAGKSLHRGLGSIDIAAAARSVLMVGRIKDDKALRAMVQVKSNLAPEGCSIAFELDRDNGFRWIGEYNIDADSLLQGTAPNRSPIREAEHFIKDILAEGSVKSSIIYAKAKKEGIAKRTLDTAKKNLKVKSNRIKNYWVWELH